jgi:formylmethanofuran dehydrogenase subunit E
VREVQKGLFELFRTVNSQVLAICSSCGEPHILDALADEEGKMLSSLWSVEQN